MHAVPGSFALIDLQHQGQPQSVAAALLETRLGPVLVDPGPSATLPALGAGLARLGYGLGDLHALLLTHIHLDHAAASGTLARAHPSLRVFVHESGAPHLLDPTKLLRSATRLYGERMAELWGEVAPVPPEQLRTLSGGERLELGGVRIEAAYTPGHAWHHLSYFLPGSGVAFVGDTAGIHGPRLPLVLPVTPPPDFNLEAWLGSIARILAWHPEQIVLTHYGQAPDPEAHFAALEEGLRTWTELARVSLERPGEDAERLAWFLDRLREWIAGRVAGERAERFLAGAGPEACWQGLARYWRKRWEPLEPA